MYATRTLGFTTMRICLMVISLLTGIHGAAMGAEAANDRVDLFVDDPRPTAKAIEELSSRYGYLITYEDPRYAYGADIKDVTSEVRTDVHGSPAAQVPKALVPFGGTLQLSFTVLPQTAQPEDPVKLVQQLLDGQAATGNGGIFRLGRTGERLHVVPAQVRNSRGEWVEQTSILDAPITIAEQERNGYEMLEAICAAVSEATNTHVVVGTIPLNLLYQFRARQTADNEAARDVLLRTLDATNPRLTWQLFYGPDVKWFALNLRVIPNRAPRNVPVEQRPPATPDPMLRPQTAFGGLLK